MVTTANPYLDRIEQSLRLDPVARDLVEHPLTTAELLKRAQLPYAPHEGLGIREHVRQLHEVLMSERLSPLNAQQRKEGITKRITECPDNSPDTRIQKMCSIQGIVATWDKPWRGTGNPGPVTATPAAAESVGPAAAPMTSGISPEQQDLAPARAEPAPQPADWQQLGSAIPQSRMDASIEDLLKVSTLGIAALAKSGPDGLHEIAKEYGYNKAQGKSERCDLLIMTLANQVNFCKDRGREAVALIGDHLLDKQMTPWARGATLDLLIDNVRRISQPEIQHQILCELARILESNLLSPAQRTHVISRLGEHIPYFKSSSFVSGKNLQHKAYELFNATLNNRRAEISKVNSPESQGELDRRAIRFRGARKDLSQNQIGNILLPIIRSLPYQPDTCRPGHAYHLAQRQKWPINDPCVWLRGNVQNRHVNYLRMSTFPNEKGPLVQWKYDDTQKAVIKQKKTAALLTAPVALPNFVTGAMAVLRPRPAIRSELLKTILQELLVLPKPHDVESAWQHVHDTASSWNALLKVTQYFSAADQKLVLEAFGEHLKTSAALQPQIIRRGLQDAEKYRYKMAARADRLTLDFQQEETRLKRAWRKVQVGEQRRHGYEPTPAARAAAAKFRNDLSARHAENAAQMQALRERRVDKLIANCAKGNAEAPHVLKARIEEIRPELLALFDQRDALRDVRPTLSSQDALTAEAISADRNRTRIDLKMQQLLRPLVRGADLRLDESLAAVRQLALQARSKDIQRQAATIVNPISALPETTQPASLRSRSGVQKTASKTEQPIL